MAKGRGAHIRDKRRARNKLANQQGGELRRQVAALMSPPQPQPGKNKKLP